uniref:Uncharacterized protein n=1 Tax=Lygus hesperus TaxID=30085 RepID=A0A146LTF5_LYGHE
MGKLASLGISDPVKVATKDAKQHGKLYSNTFGIDFLYFNPLYNTHAQEFVPYMFTQYNMCEFAAIKLAHDISESPLLQPFQYTHLRCYKPTEAGTEKQEEEQ